MPEVRFGEIAHGQRFFWQDREWVKIGPLLAQRKGRPDPVMLRRSTLVRIKDATATTPIEGRSVPPGEMDRLFREIGRLTELLPLEESDKKEFLAATRKLFVAALQPSRSEDTS